MWVALCVVAAIKVLLEEDERFFLVVQFESFGIFFCDSGVSDLNCDEVVDVDHV